MKDILRENESRRLKVIELLFHANDWMALAELSRLTNNSPRILKYDFVYFKDTFEDFTIETSHKGVRIVFHHNRSLKTLYKNVLEHSPPFQLLETIFFEEHYTVFGLAEKLFVSPSTVYRMIEHINKVSLKYDFKIITNPCKIVGSEQEIRYFFNSYFFEKYTRLDWPYEHSKHIGLDDFLQFLIDLRQNTTDFAYYNLFKLSTIVNLTRYKNGHILKLKGTRSNRYKYMPDFTNHTEAIAKFEKSLRIEFTDEFIQQVFYLYTNGNFYLNYDDLTEKMTTNKKLRDQVVYLENFLESLERNHQVPLINQKEIILRFINSTSTEAFDPRSGFVLYNRNKHFADVIHDSFPQFYEQLYDGIIGFRKLAGLPLTDNQIHFTIYLIIASWEKILPALRRSLEKINILVISNRHTSHSNLIKDFIEYEFSEQLVIDIFNRPFLTESSINNKAYDFIISNFPLPTTESVYWICIENIPTFNDISKIQQAINHVIKHRIPMALYTK